jgi:hypothetical protein
MEGEQHFSSYDGSSNDGELIFSAIEGSFLVSWKLGMMELGDMKVWQQHGSMCIML